MTTSQLCALHMLQYYTIGLTAHQLADIANLSTPALDDLVARALVAASVTRYQSYTAAAPRTYTAVNLYQLTALGRLLINRARKH